MLPQADRHVLVESFKPVVRRVLGSEDGEALGPDVTAPEFHEVVVEHVAPVRVFLPHFNNGSLQFLLKAHNLGVDVLGLQQRKAEVLPENVRDLPLRLVSVPQEIGAQAELPLQLREQGLGEVEPKEYRRTNRALYLAGDQRRCGPVGKLWQIISGYGDAKTYRLFVLEPKHTAHSLPDGG